MRTLVSTVWRTGRAERGADIMDTLRQLGATEIVIDATLPREMAEPLLGQAAALEHAGAARLCSDDREERLAAVNAAAESVRRAGGAGLALVTTGLGAADVKWDPAQVALSFARDEWSPARLRKDRAAVAARHLDGARFALERLIPVCERESVKLGIVARQTPVELPSADELRALLDDFRGAPMGGIHDTAAAHWEHALEFESDWLSIDLMGARAADACGLAGPLAPGLGEVDFTAIAKLPFAILVAPPDTRPDELTAAITTLGGL